MSTIYSLLIFLFYLSPLACTARLVGLADMGVSNTRFILHGKVEKQLMEVVKFERELVGGGSDRSGRNKQYGDAVNTHKRSFEENYKNGESSNLVPNKKQPEQPVFLSDYARPNTRPPSHN